MSGFFQSNSPTFNVVNATEYQIAGVNALRRAGDFTRILDGEGENRAYFGDTDTPLNAFDNTTNQFRSKNGGTVFLSSTVSGTDILGEARCDTFRIDAAPTAETPTATHTAVISLNGTSYKFLCLAA